MKFNCRQIFALLFIAIFVIVSAGYAERSQAHVNVGLASAGSSHYVVRCPNQPSDMEQLATKELQSYLNKISQTKFELINKQSKKSIVVCQIQSLSKIAPGVELPQLKGEEYGIFDRDGNLYLIGGQGRSVLYAVYDFLHSLGCRWLAPDFTFYAGTNELIPQISKLTYSQPADVIERPAMKYRKLYVEEGLSHNEQNLLSMIEWMPKQRFNVLVFPIDYQGEGRICWERFRAKLTPELQRRGIMIEVGGHGYQNFLNATMEDGKLYKDHMEWFGMDNKGQRSTTPNRVFCSSNPDAVSYLQNSIIDYLRKHDEIDIFAFWPPDGAKWCECEKCRAMGEPSKRHAILVSGLAQRLKKENLNVMVECIAYSSYLTPPEGVALDRNILLDFCPIQQCFEYQIYDERSNENKTYRQALEKWLKVFSGDISIYSYYRKYAWLSLPVIIPHYMQKDVQFFQSIGVNGISTYAEPGDWFTYELNHYVLGNLVWNPDVDVNSVVMEFCTARYGAAADTAELVYNTLEDTVRHGCSIPFTSLKKPAEYDYYLSNIRSCITKIDAAAKQNSTDAGLSANLGRLKLMLEYADKNMVIRRLQAQKGDKEQMRQMVEEIVGFLKKNANTGVFLVHYRLDIPLVHRFYGLAKQ